MPRRIDLSSHQAVRQVFGNARPLPQFRFPRRVVSPSRMDQAREEGHAAESVSVRIGLAVEPVHPFQPRLQFLRRRARPRFTPPVRRPLRSLDHPVLLGTPRIVPVHLDTQPEHPERQVGGEVARRSPGGAIIDPQAVGQAPTRERSAEFLADRTGSDLRPGPEGGKPWCGAPRHCTRQSCESNSPLDYYIILYAPLHSSAISHEATWPAPR